MFKKYIVIQDGIKECGVACLLSIIRYYKGNVSLDYLLDLTNTSKEGTSFYNIKEAALEIGFKSIGYKIDKVEEIEFERPLIAQVIINNLKHFVVIYEIKNNSLLIMDPACGLKKINFTKFNTIFTGNILLLEPIKKIPVFDNENYLLNIITDAIYLNKNLIKKILLFTVFIIIFTCIYGYNLKVIVDYLITTNKFNLLLITILFIIILFFKSIFIFLRNNLIFYLNQKLDLSIIKETIKKIILLPYSYYKNKTTGEIISRINDLFYIKNIISKIITSIILDNIIAIVILILLFIINRNMTYLLLILTIVYIIIFLVFKKNIELVTDNVQEDNANVNSYLVESINGYESIKGLSLENNFIKELNKKYFKTTSNNLNMNKILNYSDLLINLFEGIILLFITYLGSTYIMDKSFTIGSLLTYNMLLSYYIIPVKNFIDLYNEYYYIRNSIKRINNILNYKYDFVSQNSNLIVYGDIVINNLSFSYNSLDNIIDNISLKIPLKSKILILGSSGSGKSTLLKILYKYYSVKRNMVFIGKYDINDYPTSDIRNNITYISQNETLFSDSIKNNIILNREISYKDFLDVCKLVEVDKFINEKNIDYDYLLEESGSNISGGQKQRIVLARSLLKKSNIILIDEGLNEIDIDLERRILKNIFNKYKDKTFIIISHRKDNMDLYDKVISIDKGKIISNFQRKN